MKYLFIIGFVLMAAAQWYAPLSMIYGAEKTITDGTEYRFKTRPVDPTDPFRGKYVTLTFQQELYTMHDTAKEKFDPYQKAYALLTDSAGYASIAMLVPEPPESDVDYFEVTVNYPYDKTMLSIEFPFNRFYVEESKASEAEQVYWNSRRDSSEVYAKVRIRNGSATLTDVMVNDSSLLDIVRRINQQKD